MRVTHYVVRVASVFLDSRWVLTTDTGRLRPVTMLHQDGVCGARVFNDFPMLITTFLVLFQVIDLIPLVRALRVIRHFRYHSHQQGDS